MSVRRTRAETQCVESLDGYAAARSDRTEPEEDAWKHAGEHSAHTHAEHDLRVALEDEHKCSQKAERDLLVMLALATELLRAVRP